MSSSVPQPIPGRHRSASMYSLSSLPALSHSPSISPNSPTLPQLSPSLSGKSLTQIFSGPQSPLKSASAFKTDGPGFAGIMKPGVVEEEDDEHAHDDFHGEFPASPPRSHTRHTSIGSWGRPGEMDRGQGILRRLSLGSAFAQRPSPAVMNSSPPQIHQPTPAPRDSPVLRKPSPLRGNGNSLGLQVQDPVKQRGISPMGERMLKGHFDGFGM
ncbi:hypothetical protein RSOLAG22IIIB_03533 [Rhizoctonia solani]|uniref:Uncharacterized protein n=1 Tax=Rhizoctonia solani TaxID=456999 RepID=A0A0K6FQI2_9AGAM|nr:hypothetical protein RSOLAG22IIIB_03533 [Rhizoctonia solani]